MHVFEQQQRNRPAAFEQAVVARLYIHQVALAELVEQLRQAIALGFRQGGHADQAVQRQAFLAQFGARIVEQQGREFQQLAVIGHGLHSWICTV
ncbi:hypothetical protein FQZ97_1228630 [compost metagenome]